MRLKLVTIGTSTGLVIPKKELTERSLQVGDEVDVTIKAAQRPKGYAYEDITAHGRFQPVLHVNHWNYLKEAFRLSEHVRLLITNPYPQEAPEAHDDSAAWRSQSHNNPFTYEERVYMFEKFFEAMGIPKNRYSIEPFDITNMESFKVLDTDTPNLVNVYSDWSASKAEKFRASGLTVMQLDQPRVVETIGNIIRELIATHSGDLADLEPKLIAAGFMPEAVPGLLDVLERRKTEFEKA